MHKNIIIGILLVALAASTASLVVAAGGGTYDAGTYNFPFKLGVGTSTPNAIFQATASSTNATSSIEIGKTAQNKGSCIKMYRHNGTATYLTVNNANFLVVSTTTCQTGL